MPQQSPSGAIINARVRTQDVEVPLAEAVRWANGRIVEVGSTAAVLQSADGHVYDAAGAVVTPGLIDSHSHPFWGAELSRGRNLEGVETFADYVSAMRAEARDAEDRGEHWVFGWNLDYRVFGSRPLTAIDLDTATGDMPALVMMHDVHTAIASTSALRVAAISGTEQLSEGAQVVLSAVGEPSGELREHAAYHLAYRVAPKETLDMRCDRAITTLRRMSATGLTGCVVMDGSLETLGFLEELESRYELPIKVDVALWHDPERDDVGVSEFIEALGRRGRRWKTGLIKLFIDGVVETGTAWLHEPDTCGGSTKSTWRDHDRFVDVVDQYVSAGFQIATHAIGDRAVSEVLDAYERVGPRASNHAGHRIEHIETLLDRDVARFAQLGVVASMQPLQMQWRRMDASDRWSSRMGRARAARGYRTRDLLATGATVVLGSDWPVTPFDPRVGMAWARFRRHAAKPVDEAFEPEQRMSGVEALAGYTSSAADALGDPTRGQIALGRSADFTVFDGDPTDASAERLTNLEVLATYVDGLRTYERNTK